MPRIPDEEIERVKRDIDIVALIQSKGIELNRHGSKDLIGLSPFTEEKEASFIVTPDKNLFHCMSSGKGGSTIDFVMHYEGVSFRHAYELLASGDPKTLMRSSEQKDQARIRKLTPPVDFDADDHTLLTQVIDYYHDRLKQTPDALAYLQKRGLHHSELLDTFKIGFADRTIGLRLPEKNRKAGADIRERLTKIGIYRESGHEHFNGSLVIPIMDEHGRITEIYGRKIGDRLRKGTPNHLYLPGPHRGIFNPRCLSSSEIILTESLIDALTFWAHGLRNVTCIYGTEGFSDELVDAFIEHKVKTIKLAYDNDEAGNRAIERDADKLRSLGLEVYRVRFPFGMDPNEYANKVTPAAKSLEQAVRSAEWLAGTTPITNKFLAANVSCSVADPEQRRGAAKSEKTELVEKGEHWELKLGPRTYRVTGLDKNNSFEALKITLRLVVEDDEAPLFHLDTLDLCQDHQRRKFIDRAAEETKLEKELIKRDLGKLLFQLEQVQEERLRGDATETVPAMSPSEREEVLQFLQSPDLMARIAEAFDQSGIVGEDSNKLIAYLACTSRKLKRPLAVIIQSTSAAGKSVLMESVLSMFPEEERIKYSAMTGQSLYYLGETDLRHKILAIVEEEGAEKASYALKLLQSEGELTIASTGKDPHTGRMETQEYHVEGPVMIFLTTTAIDIDEELMNRCLVLTVDEGQQQTERIHVLQRQARTLDGMIAREERKKVLQVMQHAQRLLKPYEIVNPFAEELTFVSDRTRSRRDHEKYLTLIEAVTLVHQHQRPIETHGSIEFIRTTIEDIEIANRLAPEVLGRSLDELPPQTRKLLTHLKGMVKAECEAKEIEQKHCFFSRRQLREHTGWSVTQVKVHLDRLQELEYVMPRVGRPGAAFQYELLIDCTQEDSAWHVGLLDVEMLRGNYDDNLSELNPDLSAQMGTCRIPDGVGSDRLDPIAAVL